MPPHHLADDGDGAFHIPEVSGGSGPPYGDASAVRPGKASHGIYLIGKNDCPGIAEFEPLLQTGSGYLDGIGHAEVLEGQGKV